MTSPIVQATVQSAILSATSNILAQVITAWRTERPFALDPTPLFRYVFFSILNTPPNFLWQQALETWFPAYTHPSEDRKVAVGKGAGHKRLHLGNTFMKLLLDMTLGATVNTVLFVAAMSGMRGAGQEEILETVQREYWPLMMAGIKLWPAVSLMNFTIIPVDRRVVIGSLVGVGWGVYLNLVAER